ncbi:hypothetical protein [Streptococcus suis]|uniref:hypothetical protein n=2 Tax=Streptococcus suis TaxID=1307 RepID=UPI0005CCBA0D|nr:hypothetical protein [Streptococcus suis]
MILAKTKRGRPTKMTQGTVKKLEEAFLRGLSDEEACLYADISKPTLYDYCDKNPDFFDRKELLKQRVKTRAKLNISKAIEDGDIDLSKWYLERRDNDFKTKQAVTHDGEVNINQTNPFADLTTDELRKLIDDG